jgi:hypothetical protein
MSDYELTPEDTTAMRGQADDWRTYLRGEIAQGAAKRDAKAPKRPPSPPPGRRPGAWPPGTRPPDPPPPVPPEEAARAVAEYRAWAAAGHPRIQTTCECTPCQLIDGGTR